jgi:hypothetical protein
MEVTHILAIPLMGMKPDLEGDGARGASPI